MEFERPRKQIFIIRIKFVRIHPRTVFSSSQYYIFAYVRACVWVCVCVHLFVYLCVCVCVCVFIFLYITIAMLGAVRIDLSVISL